MGFHVLGLNPAFSCQLTHNDTMHDHVTQGHRGLQKQRAGDSCSLVASSPAAETDCKLPWKPRYKLASAPPSPFSEKKIIIPVTTTVLLGDTT